MNVGQITQVMGAVVDVEFDNSSLPPIYRHGKCDYGSCRRRDSRSDLKRGR